MFSASFFACLILASSSLARPSIKERIERRAEGSHKSLPKQRGNKVTGHHNDLEYSSNWSGAVFDSASGTYTSVTATFIVPTPQAPTNATSGTTYSASAWVGIDGDTCGSAILQTGLDFTITNGKVSYDAWYEWFPDYAYDFSGFSIHPGDQIKLTVTAKTTKSGTAQIQNLTTGKTVSKNLSSSSALCEANAEWIVEDYSEGNALVPFANFGKVVFSNAAATTKKGAKVGPSGANLIDLENSSGQVITSVSTTSNSVTVAYV